MREAGPSLPVRSLRLAALWALLAAAPLLAGALAGPSTDAPPLADAARWILGLAVTLLPAVWAAVAPEEPAGSDWRDAATARAREALLLAAVTAPALGIALPFAALPGDAAARAIVHAACTLCGAGLLVVSLPRRAPRIAVVSAWSGGLGALGIVWRDLLAQRPLVVEVLSPPLAQARLIDERESLALVALAAVAAPASIVLVGMAIRRRRARTTG